MKCRRVFVSTASAAALSLSNNAVSWHTPDWMKTTARSLPSAVAASAKPDAKPGSSPPAGSIPQVTYGVKYLPGGIDRVILFKRDAARSLCVQVTLASPGVADLQMLAGKLDLPPDWAVERAILVRDANACGSPVRRWPEGAVNAVAISGSVRWTGGPTQKTTVDLTLSFPARGSEPASTEQLAFRRPK